MKKFFQSSGGLVALIALLFKAEDIFGKDVEG